MGLFSSNSPAHINLLLHIETQYYFEENPELEIMDNLTAILYNTDDIRMEQTPIPTPGDDDVLLKMDSVGICGSDVHYWTHGAIGDFIVRAPMVLGHEAAGVVTKLGSSVSNLKVGDRVAIEPGVPCAGCDFARLGCITCALTCSSAQPPLSMATWPGITCMQPTSATSCPTMSA